MALPAKFVETALDEAGIEFELSDLECAEFDYQSICINKETQTVQIIGHQALEKTVTSLLKKRSVGLQHDDTKVVIDTEPTLTKLRGNGIELSYEQLRAFNGLCNNSLSIINGGTKTGKTLVVRAAIDALLTNGENVRLISPSTYAEEIGLLSVITESIQSFISKSKSRNRRCLLDKAFVIVDEAQIIDFLSLYKLLKHLPTNSKICFVGDHKKLPPLGPGNMFQQLVLTESSYVSRFEHSYDTPCNGLSAFRKALSITDNQFDIHAIPNEQFTSPESISIFQNTETSHEVLSNLAANLWLEAFERYNQTSKVVCSSTSLCEKINEKIQQVRFYRMKIPSFSTGESVFYESDPVLFKTKCTFLDIASGEFAFIHKIYEDSLLIHGRECLASISMGGEIIEMSKDDLECLSISYALTAHKLQGKEIENAIVILDNPYLINKSWLYTVVAAIRESMLLVGSREHLETAISSNTYSEERYFGIPLKLEALYDIRNN